MVKFVQQVKQQPPLQSPPPPPPPAHEAPPAPVPAAAAPQVDETVCPNCGEKFELGSPQCSCDCCDAEGRWANTRWCKACNFTFCPMCFSNGRYALWAAKAQSNPALFWRCMESNHDLRHRDLEAFVCLNPECLAKRSSKKGRLTEFGVCSRCTGKHLLAPHLLVHVDKSWTLSLGEFLASLPPINLEKLWTTRTPVVLCSVCNKEFNLNTQRSALYFCTACSHCICPSCFSRKNRHTVPGHFLFYGAKLCLPQDQFSTPLPPLTDDDSAELSVPAQRLVVQPQPPQPSPVAPQAQRQGASSYYGGSPTAAAASKQAAAEPAVPQEIAASIRGYYGTQQPQTAETASEGFVPKLPPGGYGAYSGQQPQAPSTAGSYGAQSIPSGPGSYGAYSGQQPQAEAPSAAGSYGSQSIPSGAGSYGAYSGQQPPAEASSAAGSYGAQSIPSGPGSYGAYSGQQPQAEAQSTTGSYGAQSIPPGPGSYGAYSGQQPQVPSSAGSYGAQSIPSGAGSYGPSGPGLYGPSGSGPQQATAESYYSSEMQRTEEEASAIEPLSDKSSKLFATERVASYDAVPDEEDSASRSSPAPSPSPQLSSRIKAAKERKLTDSVDGTAADVIPDPGVIRPTTVLASKPMPAHRDWNAELQAIISLPDGTNTERRNKELFLLCFMLEFEQVVKRVGSKIISEVHLPPDRKTICQNKQVGGVAGGQKYLTHGLFFKFSIDHLGIYGGDEFASKATAHELNGCDAFLHFITSGSSPLCKKLHLPMMSIIDFMGFRVAAMSQLPLSSSSLHYGSGDGGVTAKKDIPELNAVMADAGRFINLKEHVVGRREQVQLFGPCDIEGHLGTDGSFYVVDTARVFPPETVSKFFAAIQIHPVSLDHFGASHWNSAAQLSELSLPVKNWEKRLLEILGVHKLERLKFSSGVLCFTGTGDLNMLASVLLGRYICGVAVLIPAGYHGKHLYNLLRPELVDANPVPLSSDAFTGFGRIDSAIHNAEVRRATQELKFRIIPQFLQDLISKLFILNGRDLAEEMHKRGINMRYLAFCHHSLVNLHAKSDEARQKQKHVLSLIAAEVVSRATKSLFRASMRRIVPLPEDSPERIQERIVETIIERMNMLLRLTPQSEGFWNGVVRIQVATKYTGIVNYVSRDIWNALVDQSKDKHFRFFLFKALQRQLGLVFRIESDVVGHLVEGRPFDARDVDSVEVIVQRRLDILSRFAPERDSFNLHEELAVLEVKQRIVNNVIGDKSRESAIVRYQIALVHAKLRNLRACLEDFELAQAAWPETPVDLGAAAFYSAALLCGPDAFQMKEVLLKNAQSLLSNEYWDTTSGHPFELLVLDELAKLLWERGKDEEAHSFATRFYEIHKLSFTHIPKAIRREYFGSVVPFCLTLALGIEADRYDGLPELGGHTGRDEEPDDDTQFDTSKLPQWLLRANIHRDYGRLLHFNQILDPSVSASISNSILVWKQPEAPARELFDRNPESEFVTYTCHPFRPNEPVPIPELLGVPIKTVMFNGHGSFFAITLEGAVFSWGKNFDCVLGHEPKNTDVPKPRQIMSLSGIRKVSSAKGYSLFLSDSGDVYACGRNHNGSLGTGDTNERTQPVIIQTLEGEECADVIATESCAFAVSRDGKTFVWGRFSQMSEEHGPTLVPTPIDLLADFKIVSLAATTKAVFFLDNHGAVFTIASQKRLAVTSLKSHNIVEMVSLVQDVLFLADDGTVFGHGPNKCGLLCTGDRRHTERESFGQQSVEKRQVFISQRLSELRPIRLYGASTSFTGVSGDGHHPKGAALVTPDGRPFYWGVHRPIPLPIPTIRGRHIYSIALVSEDTILVSAGKEEPLRARATNSRAELREPCVRLANPKVPVVALTNADVFASGMLGPPSLEDTILLLPADVPPPPSRPEYRKYLDRAHCSGNYVAPIFVPRVGQTIACLYQPIQTPRISTDPPSEPEHRLIATSPPFEVQPFHLNFTVTAEYFASSRLTLIFNCVPEVPLPFPIGQRDISLHVRVERFVEEMMETSQQSSQRDKTLVFHWNIRGEGKVSVLLTSNDPRVVPLCTDQPVFEIENKAYHPQENKIEIIGDTKAAPRQDIRVRWKHELVTSEDLMMWIPEAGPFEMENSAGAVTNIVDLNGETTTQAPHLLGRFILSFVRISSAAHGTKIWYGKSDVVSVERLMDTPTKFTVFPDRAAMGERITVTWELPPTAMMLVDMIGVYKGMSVVAMQRIEQRAGSIELELPPNPFALGQCEVRFMTMCIGDTELSCSKSLPFEFYAKDQETPQLASTFVAALAQRVASAASPVPPAPEPAAPAPEPTTPASKPATGELPASWEEFFKLCGVPDDAAVQYAETFRDGEIELSQIPDLTNDILRDMDVKPGHRMKVMKHISQQK